MDALLRLLINRCIWDLSNESILTWCKRHWLKHHAHATGSAEWYNCHFHQPCTSRSCSGRAQMVSLRILEVFIGNSASHMCCLVPTVGGVGERSSTVP